MRTIRLLLLWVLGMITISCSAQRTLSDVASMKGVTSVYIGKAMLKLAGSTMSIGKDETGLDISKLIKDLTSIEIITCEDKKIANEVQKKCQKALSKYPMEVITEVKDDGQNVEISGVFEKDGDILNMLLISVTGSDEPTYILMKGKINIETLNTALIKEIDN